MNKYTVDVYSDIVIVCERDEDGNTISKFQFEKYVFENRIGIDTLMGVIDIQNDDNFHELLDEYRE